MVSIHGPLGYGPSTLPLRHSAVLKESIVILDLKHQGYPLMQCEAAQNVVNLCAAFANVALQIWQ